jgi:predicted O-methyltransferase YrrM
MVGRGLRSLARTGRAHLQTARLAGAGGDAARIATAIREAWSGRLTDEEHAHVQRIEALRAELLASSEILHLRDFGAPPLEWEQPETPGWMRPCPLAEMTRASSKPPKWALLLFKLLRVFDPQVAVELGTCVGISTAYESAALKLNGGGKLFTFEGAPELADVAQRNLNQLGLAAEIVRGVFHETLGPALPRLGRVGYAFIDGHHDEKATVEYFRTLLPVLTPGALVVFDDIDWTSGMRRAWQALEQDPNISLSVDMGPLAVCIVGNANVARKNYSVRLGGLFA